MLERRKQERAEAAFLRVYLGEVVASQQPGEKPLGQVLRVVGIIAAPTGVGVKRVPVSAAEFLQRFLRAR